MTKSGRVIWLYLGNVWERWEILIGLKPWIGVTIIIISSSININIKEWDVDWFLLAQSSVYLQTRTNMAFPIS
jgi:hypothetical protein